MESEVQPHTTSLVVWDVPSAIVIGERFGIKVGVKCSSECNLTHTAFAVYNHEGTQIGTGTLPGDRWPGTTGLYVAEVDLEAPAGEGFYTWSVRSLGSDAAVPHADGTASFGVNVVARPEYVVTVETVDKASATPLSGARVVMHPYRAETDERGVARVRVAKGAYRLFVSQTKYVTIGLPIEVTGDLTTRAELDLAPVAERN